MEASNAGLTPATQYLTTSYNSIYDFFCFLLSFLVPKALLNDFWDFSVISLLALNFHYERGHNSALVRT
jgi:hypothetical protein